MTPEQMRRGAAEANAENARLAQAAEMGKAIGGLASLIAAINKLTERLDSIDERLKTLEQKT